MKHDVIYDEPEKYDLYEAEQARRDRQRDREEYDDREVEERLNERD